MLADADADIFDGLVIDTRLGPGGHRFVDAPQVDGLYADGVVLTLDAAAAERLPEPSANPAVRRGRPRRRRARRPRRQAQARLELDLGQLLAAVRVLSPTTTASRPRGCRRCAARCCRSTDIELAVIAPDSNRSAIGRGITTRRPLWVQEVDFGDGTVGYATDGTPVDCVRFAALGLVEGFEAELIVSGINHGSNLGDDISYSGTVAAAIEGIVLGLPGARGLAAVASRARWTSGSASASSSTRPRRSPRAWSRRSRTCRCPAGTLLNLNFPAGEIAGVEVARLGKRIYRDELVLQDEQSGRRQYRIYGDAPDYERQEGTDLAAVADGRVAVTPIHFDLTDVPGIETLQAYDLARLLAPAAREVE